MKLIDILVERLEEWPDGVNYITGKRDGCCHIIGFENLPNFNERREYWCTEKGHIWGEVAILADDWKESIVTKFKWLEAKQEMNINMNKQFTKADMKDGMRFVLRNGDVYYWCEDYDCPMVNGNMKYGVCFIENDLTHYADCEDFDIMKVYALGELVWKRVEETEQEKKLKELQETIAKAEQQIKEIMGGK